jgi:hypothetical protein
MATQTHTEARRYAVKKEEESEDATSQVVSRALVEIRRSNVAALDRRRATIVNRFLERLRLQEFLGRYFPPNVELSAIKHEQLRQARTT